MSQVGRGLETTLCAIITAAGTDRMRLPSEDGIGGEGGKARAGNGKGEEARVSWEGGGGQWTGYHAAISTYRPPADRSGERRGGRRGTAVRQRGTPCLAQSGQTG